MARAAGKSVFLYKSLSFNPIKLGWVSATFAVILFSFTVPMTKLALADYSPLFIAFARASIAGFASLLLILIYRWPPPSGREFPLLVVGGLAVNLVFPYTISHVLVHAEAADMGVILAITPLLTALFATLFFRERHAFGFWLSAGLGTACLMHFAVQNTSGSVHGYLLIALVSAGLGYGVGGHAAKTLGGWRTICWMTALYFPLTAVVYCYLLFRQASLLDSFTANPAVIFSPAFFALCYLAIISQWVGFHFWYGAMAKIGIAKTGLLQLLQPLFTLLFVGLLLGEKLERRDFLYAVTITTCVALAGRVKNKTRIRVGV